MTIRLNGTERELPDGTSVAAALHLLDIGPHARGVAVAVDREVVPRGRWHDTVLTEGCNVEIVMAIQGG